MCPKNKPTTPEHEITIVSEYGITVIRAVYCACDAAESPANQLLRARLIPATLERPQHAFTEGALRRWHHDALISNASAWDHLKKLIALSNVIGTPDHKVDGAMW